MFATQNTIERKQKSIQVDNRRLVTNIPTLCAWCLSEQGIPAGEGSHGICKPHATWLLEQWKKRGRRRHQN
jgi:hypothetical protein